MLRSLNDLQHYQVSASDGTIGNVANFLLDDEHWTIRYLVADTGGVLDGRQVLISPMFLRQADWLTHRFHVALNVDKIKQSPSVTADEPVSRQHERDYYRYYGYPYYWGGSGIWGMGSYPTSLTADSWSEMPSEHSEKSKDAHLRSARELRGYHVDGTDGGIGHIDDFVVDDETWEVRYLVVNTSNWWLGKKVLVAPRWARRVSWEDRRVYFNLSRQVIKDSPAWDASAAVNRAYEAHLYDYYGRPAYWD